MKILKLLLVMAFIVASSSLAIADESTDGTTWQTPSDSLNDYLNEYAKHEHGVTEIDDEVGLGIDVIYDFSETHAAKLETRYDLNAERTNAWEVYAVYQLRLGN